MKPEDLLKLIEQFKKLLSDTFFQGTLPTWLSSLFNFVLLLIFALLALWGVLFVLGQIKKIWIEQFWPLFYKQEQKRRLLKRQRFAQHIEHEICQLNNREEWKDYRFTELEAEVEAEGRRRRRTLIPFLNITQRGLRREKSLSKALESSSERLILVEGDPGSGKSVALRHITEQLAQHTKKSRNIKSVIPLYINLKKLERSSQEVIDKNLIDSFVRKELNRINDRDIEHFIDEEFPLELKEGTLLFLFDSFDELPEVLSSIESDKVITEYAEAIDNFLSGFSRCRGIIASRQFRGPKHLGWPHFRVLPLEDRRLQLIRKAELDPGLEKELIGQLSVAPPEIQDMTKNPMFLGILCENMRSGSPFPKNTHSVFENYLEKRLNRDKDRLTGRFNLEPSEIRTIAEKVAFCMSLDPGLGLSPTRQGLASAMSKLNLRVPGNFDQLLNALEYLKLARSETDTVAGEPKMFTFAHRRFQEYFSTCVVLGDLTRISPRLLLTDGRWRETTVVIFQTQVPETFAPILTEAKHILDEMIVGLPGLIDDPIEYVNREPANNNISRSKPFSWTAGLLHLLALLQDGFISRMKDLPNEIQVLAGRILLSASSQGTLVDRKWSLEIAGITPQPVLLWLLRDAFSSDSQWLREVAYRQAAQLSKIPDDIATAIRNALLSLFASNRLNKQRFVTYTHLSRLDQSAHYIRVLRLLLWIGPIDTCLHIVIFVFLLLLSFSKPHYFMVGIILLPILFSSPFNVKSIAFISSMSQSLEKEKQRLLLYNPFTILRILCFPLSWSFFAILASEVGQFTHPYWWLFLILFPFLYLASNRSSLNRLLNQLFILFKRKYFYNLLASLSLSCLVGVCLGIWLVNNENTVLYKLIVSGLILIQFIVFCIFLTQVIKSFIYFYKDSEYWKRWIKTRPETMTTRELLNFMNQYHNQEFCKSLLVLSREKNLLLSTKDSEELLSELALALEQSLFLAKRKRMFILENKFGYMRYMSLVLNLSRSITKQEANKAKEIMEAYSGSEVFSAWLEQYTRKDKTRFILLGSKCLDEVYILLEQLRARRMTAESSE